MEVLTGKLLIAIPELGDPNFFRTVVLVLMHGDEGATGVILNRPSNETVATVWDEWSDLACDCPQFVQVGGPVDGPLIALHTSLAIAESQVLPGVFLTMDRDHLNQLVSQDEHDFRIFRGYSGWAPGQLESEIECGGWLLCEGEFEHVFESDDQALWKMVCEQLGHEIMLPHFSPSRHFVDPGLN
ncbi:MAG: YqgE/AlgH family protein [Planctomycetota bacterium]|nr:YqgE/AlgH family protein [Planctomycetota bacterium]